MWQPYPWLPITTDRGPFNTHGRRPITRTSPLVSIAGGRGVSSRIRPDRTGWGVAPQVKTLNVSTEISAFQQWVKMSVGFRSCTRYPRFDLPSVHESACPWRIHTQCRFRQQRQCRVLPVPLVSPPPRRRRMVGLAAPDAQLYTPGSSSPLAFAWTEGVPPAQAAAWREAPLQHSRRSTTMFLGRGGSSARMASTQLRSLNGLGLRGDATGADGEVTAVDRYHSGPEWLDHAADGGLGGHWEYATAPGKL